jgi:hypothetical protein
MCECPLGPYPRCCSSSPVAFIDTTRDGPPTKDEESWRSPDALPEYIAGFDLGYSGHIPGELEAMYHSPLKLYEHMAMDVPIVASRVGDVAELIKDSVNGFFFALGDKEDLKQTFH